MVLRWAAYSDEQTLVEWPKVRNKMKKTELLHHRHTKIKINNKYALEITANLSTFLDLYITPCLACLQRFVYLYTTVAIATLTIRRQPVFH